MGGARRGAPHAFVGLVALTLLGQLALLAYEIALTRRFGTTEEADALALAFMVAFALANELVGWIGMLFIPLYVATETREGSASAGSLLSAAFLATALAAVALGLGTFAVAPLLLPLLATGPGSAASLLRLFSPLVLLLPAAAVLANALHARERFAAAALRPLLWYGAALLAILGAADSVGPAVVPIGMTLGLSLYALALGGATRRLACRATAAAWSQIRGLAPFLLPLVAMSAANYLQVLLERGLAGHLATGSLAALTYAFRLVNAPITLLALTGATMLFPAMSAQAARDGPDGKGDLLRRALRTSVVLTVPLAGLLMACADPLVRVLFERGAFTLESSRLTALGLFYYAPALLGLTALQFLIRAHWALGAIGRLARIHVGAAAFGCAAMLALTWTIGYRGLPIAVTLTSLVHSGALLAGLRREIAGLTLWPIVGLTGRVCAAALIAALASVAAVALATAPLLQLSLGLAVGGLVYVALIGRVAPLAWLETRRLVALRS